MIRAAVREARIVRVKRSQFEASYNGGDATWVADGKVSIECRCGGEACSGWRVTTRDNLAALVDTGQNTLTEVHAALARFPLPGVPYAPGQVLAVKGRILETPELNCYNLGMVSMLRWAEGEPRYVIEPAMRKRTAA